MIDLSVEIAGVTLPNPVLPGSGTWELSDTHEELFAPAELGAVINKTIFTDPRPGNPPPRLWETPCGMLNSIGIPSKGLEHFLAELLPRMRRLGPPVIASIAGNSLEEFCRLAEAIDRSGQADLLELDLSCPNLSDGIPWSTREDSLREVVSAVARTVSLPVIAKLSPNVRDIGDMARIAELAGASALSMVNTYRGMAIDLQARRPALGSGSGGLSGPAIRPLAVYAVYSSYRRVAIPLIGMGGIATWRDAVEFLLAGAAAVAVGTGNFVNPLAMREVIDGIRTYLQESGFPSVRSIVGLAHGEAGTGPAGGRANGKAKGNADPAEPAAGFPD
jgi:dihydroorotate dehydrogenase (NAD+) catalytic subunit